MSARNEKPALLSAFTLVELLVVISVLSVLISILLPCLGQAKELARRAVCRNNLHQCSSIIFIYTDDNGQFLPKGNILDTSAAGYNSTWDSTDDMALMPYNTMLKLGAYGLTEKHATCETARNYFENTDGWLSPIEPRYSFVETVWLGWIYWANRGSWQDPETGKIFKTTKKTVDKATVNTLATCFCYNRYDAAGSGGQWPAWFASHVKGSFKYSVGQPMEPEPDGLAVAYLDGAVEFVKWSEIKPTNHSGQYIVYYSE